MAIFRLIKDKIAIELPDYKHTFIFIITFNLLFLLQKIPCLLENAVVLFTLIHVACLKKKML